MSNVPQFDTHPGVPVSPGLKFRTHGGPSGVPAAARCHSWFVGSRLSESAQACSACNQVMQALGFTPGIETA
jgi:hypothetical protein